MRVTQKNPGMMNNIALLHLAGAALLATSATAAVPTIDSSESVAHLGEAVVMCGSVSEVKKFSKGTYLNFGAQYPKQHITAIVWDSDEQQFTQHFGSLSRLRGQRACVRGTVTEFRGKVQIQVSNPNQLELKK